MNKLFSILFLSFFFVKIYAQDCVNLNVTEHISGDPICWLKEGDKVEICINSKTIQANNCYYHILSKKMNIFGLLIYEFGLDPNTPFFIAPVYGRLLVSPKSKTFIFSFKHTSNKGFFKYQNDIIPEEKSDEEKKNLNLSKTKKEPSYDELILEINETYKKGDYQKAYNQFNALWHKYSW
jgi:hypothetical protein|tara:strand:- start:934 stop:1473 length:540 start_codon:yes stop_codon:yes gene_type:complete